MIFCMKKYLYFIDKKTGSFKEIDKVEDADDKNQVLIIQGIDSGFIMEVGVADEDGNWVYSGKYLISKYFNHDEKLGLSISVGNYIVLSISRVVPNFEFKFEIKNTHNGNISKRIYSSPQEGLAILAKED